MAKREAEPAYQPNDAFSRADWDAVASPALTDAELARARPGTEGMPPMLAEAFARRAGRPKAEHPRVPVSLRVPAEVLEAYKAGGPGWQTRMNEALAAGLDRRAAGRPPARPRAARAGKPRGAGHTE